MNGSNQPFWEHPRRTFLHSKCYSTIETKPYRRNFNSSYEGTHYWDRWSRMHRNIFIHNIDRLFISGYAKGSYYSP